MSHNTIRFSCPACHARIKAPRQLAGERRACPGCGMVFTVPGAFPQDCEPILMLVEDEDRCTLQVGYRYQTRELGTLTAPR